MTPAWLALVAGVFYFFGRHDGGADWGVSLHYALSWAFAAFACAVVSKRIDGRASWATIALCLCAAPFAGAFLTWIGFFG